MGGRGGGKGPRGKGIGEESEGAEEKPPERQDPHSFRDKRANDAGPDGKDDLEQMAGLLGPQFPFLGNGRDTLPASQGWWGGVGGMIGEDGGAWGTVGSLSPAPTDGSEHWLCCFLQFKDIPHFQRGLGKLASLSWR